MKLRNWYNDLRQHPFWPRLADFARYYLGGLYDRTGDNHVFLKAGGMSFSLFVCFMPLMLIVFAGLGEILERPAIVSELNNIIDRAVPYQDYATKVKEIVFDRINEFKSFKRVSGIAGAIALIFAASGLFGSMRTILDSTYKIKTRHAALRGKLRDIGLLFVVLGYFLLSTTILPALNVAIRIAEESPLLANVELGLVEDVLIRAISFIIIFAAFLFIYFMVPNKRPPRRVALMSAVWATALWVVARELFGIYISHAVNIDRVYGAYAFVVIVAFWIYYTSITFIVGAEIGQLYRERRAERLKAARK
jgi:membrane protein